MGKYDVTEYRIHTDKICNGIRIAIVSDLHGKTDERILDNIIASRPDCIVVPGDFALIDRTYLIRTKATEQDSYVESATTPQWITEPWSMEKYNPGTMEFLVNLNMIAPTFLSLGNHEWMIPEYEWRRIKDNGICVLDNAYSRIQLHGNEIFIGGLTSAEVMLIRGFIDYNGYPKYRWRHEHFEHTDALSMEWMNDFRKEIGLKILLCHHPEYMIGDDTVVDLNGLDIALAGHAHGGQIRIGHLGLYAPGQGLFPKYIEGSFEKDGAKVVISRGLSNTYKLPRIHNTPELVLVCIDSQLPEAENQ